jgi:2-hydroxychromene-2-carboxylate isomerase
MRTLRDLDSCNVETPHGWVRGSNAQAATEQQIVIAAEVTVDSPTSGIERMVKATETDLAAAGITGRPHVVVADAGHWHQRRWTA